MNLRAIATGILLVMFALILSVNAIEIRTSDDSISISSTEGNVFVYVKNTAGEARDLFLSADGNLLNAFFDPYETSIRGLSTGGGYLRVSAPDCFRGSEAVTVYAQLCGSNSCETARRKVIVYVEPAKTCSTYIEGFAPKTQFISGTSCGATGCFEVRSLEPKRSSLASTAVFDPTAYNLRITGGDSCVDVRRGEVARIKLQVSNRGAAGNFDVRAVSGSELNAFPSKDFISLQRSESEEVSLDIKPELDASEGRHFASLQLLHLDQLISEQEVCVDLFDEFKSALSAPRSFTAKTSTEAVLQLELTNDGTKTQRYFVSALNDEIQPAITVSPEQFLLKAGAAKLIDAHIDTSIIKPGTYKIQFIAANTEEEISAETVLKVAGDAPSTPNAAVETTQEQKESTVTVTAVVKNENDFQLENLELAVQNLPSGWKVSEIGMLSIPANSEKKVEFQITTTTSDEASPSLIISKGGKAIATQALPKISGKAGGFTGLFALSSQNVLIGLIVLGGLGLLLILGRRGGTESYVPSRMESIKHEVGELHHSHTH